MLMLMLVLTAPCGLDGLLKCTAFAKAHHVCPSRHRLVQEQRLADVLNLRYRALEIEGLGQDDLEDLAWLSLWAVPAPWAAHLLHVDAVARAAEDQARTHGFGKAPSLQS